MVLDFEKPLVRTLELSETEGKFAMEPLERGYGNTIGNSLRRALLSSIPGSAITSVKIAGVLHEFSTIPEVKEDVIEIIFNIRSIILKSSSSEPVVIKLDIKGPKKVKAEGIEIPPEIEILNPDLYIATVNRGGRLEMEMSVEQGYGYISAEKIISKKAPIGLIPIDSIFSPVRKVSFNVEPVRVGQAGTHERLILEIKTSGTVSPDEAASMAARIIGKYMQIWESISPEVVQQPVFGGEVDYNTPIEKLNFSTRPYNCLKSKAVNTVGELLQYSEEDLMNIRNFGKNSINELVEKLKSFSLSLRSEEE